MFWGCSHTLKKQCRGDALRFLDVEDKSKERGQVLEAGQFPIREARGPIGRDADGVYALRAGDPNLVNVPAGSSLWTFGLFDK